MDTCQDVQGVVMIPCELPIGTKVRIGSAGYEGFVLSDTFLYSLAESSASILCVKVQVKGSLVLTYPIRILRPWTKK